MALEVVEVSVNEVEISIPIMVKAVHYEDGPGPRVTLHVGLDEGLTETIRVGDAVNINYKVYIKKS
jgi:hypothetical protein